MTIARCVIFKTHLALLLLSQRCSTGGLVWATGPSEQALSDCKLALTLAFTVSNSLNWRPLISKTIQIRRTSHAGNCKRSKDKLLWTPVYGRAALVDQQRFTYFSFGWIRNAALRTHQEWQMIGMDSKIDR